MSVPAGFGFAKLTQIGRSLAQGWVGIGEQAAFYVKSLVETGEVLAKYRLELLRLVAQMSLGVGALALIGGAVMVVSFIVMNAGALVGIVGYSQLNDVGIEALVGFFAAYVNPRLVAPLITSVGLAATVGAGATAQIGAMRINEEIDALEVMGIRSIAYLVSTRVLAGVIVVIPLFCLSAILTNLASRNDLPPLWGLNSKTTPTPGSRPGLAECRRFAAQFGCGYAHNLDSSALAKEGYSHGPNRFS